MIFSVSSVKGIFGAKVGSGSASPFQFAIGLKIVIDLAAGQNDSGVVFVAQARPI
jgi:hypothetical protein